MANSSTWRLAEVAVGDLLLVFPHEICPVDGTVVEGHGVMDESYLTGEPYRISKAPGTAVLSGAINGETALTIRADKLPDRFALRTNHAGDAGFRTAAAAPAAAGRPVGRVLYASGRSDRCWGLASQPRPHAASWPCWWWPRHVLCLIAIPVAIIGAISLSARRGIIIKDPAVLEKIDTCRTAIFDKTGTLTYGEPKLTELLPAAGFSEEDALQLVASIERYSKHPLSGAILEAAESRGLVLQEAAEVSERPGEGLAGHCRLVVGSRSPAARSCWRRIPN